MLTTIRGMVSNHVSMRTCVRPGAHGSGLCACVYAHVFVPVSLSSGVCVCVCVCVFMGACARSCVRGSSYGSAFFANSTVLKLESCPSLCCGSSEHSSARNLSSVGACYRALRQHASLSNNTYGVCLLVGNDRLGCFISRHW